MILSITTAHENNAYVVRGGVGGYNERLKQATMGGGGLKSLNAKIQYMI